MANNIPTPHISAKEGEIAPSILLPGYFIFLCFSYFRLSLKEFCYAAFF